MITSCSTSHQVSKQLVIQCQTKKRPRKYATFGDIPNRFVLDLTSPSIKQQIQKDLISGQCLLHPNSSSQLRRALGLLPDKEHTGNLKCFLLSS